MQPALMVNYKSTNALTDINYIDDMSDAMPTLLGLLNAMHGNLRLLCAFSSDEYTTSTEIDDDTVATLYLTYSHEGFGLAISRDNDVTTMMITRLFTQLDDYVQEQVRAIHAKHNEL